MSFYVNDSSVLQERQKNAAKTEKDRKKKDKELSKARTEKLLNVACIRLLCCNCEEES